MCLINKLVDKSIEAFITAIEIYNKPTIHYRVEGFSFFICNAWELMLKGYLIKKHGNDSIYYKNNPDRTFSLSNCIELVFTNNKDPLRKNLERIVDLRNISTHFITEEYEQIYIPLFQSCVLNYINKMLEFFGKDVTETIPSNFLTLSIKLSDIVPEEIQARYPKQIASKLLNVQRAIASSIPENGNQKYAVVIKHDYYITKRADLATASVAITKDAKQAAFILKETKDMQKACPHNMKKCLDIINQWLRKDRIGFVNPSLSPDNEKYHRFNANHFTLFVKFYGIKDNPKFCYKYDRSSQTLYSYSDAALRFIFEEIKKNPEGIIDSLRAHNR